MKLMEAFKDSRTSMARIALIAYFIFLAWEAFTKIGTTLLASVMHANDAIFVLFAGILFPAFLGYWSKK